jgi:gamma-glutamylcysteine synthetase
MQQREQHQLLRRPLKKTLHLPKPLEKVMIESQDPREDLLVLRVQEERDKVKEEEKTVVQEVIVLQEMILLQDVIDPLVTERTEKKVSSELDQKESMIDDLELEEARRLRKVVVERAIGARTLIIGMRFPKRKRTKPLTPLLETLQRLLRPRLKS